MLQDISRLDLVMTGFVFVFGACIGSFLNVVIWRMPRGLSVVYPPSHCPKCSKPINWFDNIPIISWLTLGGKCRNCKNAISPRYIIFEALTGIMLAGLYVAYFVLRVRRLSLGADSYMEDYYLSFTSAWGMFFAHSVLLCCLLAASMIDAKFFMIPLSVMWTASIVAAVFAAIDPHPMLGAACEPVTIAVSLAAAAGLAISIYAQHVGWIEPSFIDAGGKMIEPDPQADARAAKGDKKTAKPVGFTADSGINPRLEILREVLFLLPAIVLAVAVGLWLKNSIAASSAWASLLDADQHSRIAPVVNSLGGVLVGYLCGGLWIWATRIIATFIFGREAMGLGDVHIMAAVGAATGWAIPAMAFFLAPVCGLALAVYIIITKRGRELPYGPWLAVGSLAAMLFYDPIVRFLGPGLASIFG